MRDRLAGREDGAHEPGPEHHGVESHLEELEQGDTRVTFLPGGLGERVLELSLTDIVLGAEPLLLDQLLLVLAHLSPRRGTVLAGRLGTALHDARRLGGEGNSELSGDPDFGSTQIHGWSRRAVFERRMSGQRSI
jgi:hypothetical protein